MSRVFVAGTGAVSPAGWNVAALHEALIRNEPLPVQPLERPGWEQPLRARPVPGPITRLEFLSHPRLRRASPITHYVVASALEAVARFRAIPDSKLRLGLIVCLQSGCVNYSCRFYEETLKDPATASPLLFPETVYAAPASHLAAVLGNVSIATSLVGDPACFLQGVALGAQWLDENRVEACLVIGAEEINWILADALWHLERSAVVTAGAGALCLTRRPEFSAGVELAAITDAHTYSLRANRMQAARAMRDQLVESGAPARGRMPALQELLCDGTGCNSRADFPELAAWSDWTGPRLSPKRIFGEGMMAAAAWQCVAACAALAGAQFAAANVSLVGSNQQAMGARLTRVDSGI